MAKSHPRWRMAKKILTVLFRRRRSAGGLRAKNRLAGRVEGHARLQPYGAAQRHRVGYRQLPDLWLLRPAWARLLRPQAG